MLSSLLRRKESNPGRFWEIDCLRGLAILAMISYHLWLDLSWLKGFPRPPIELAYPIAGCFIFLVGLSLSLSYSRLQGKVRFSKYLKRGLRIFGWGLGITLVTWIFTPFPVWFGILHFIGLSIILAYPILKLKTRAWIFSVLLLPLCFLPASSAVFWLLPFSFPTLDYFPLLPWFLLIPIGISVGFWLYPGYTRRFSLPGPGPFGWLSALGRRSLFVYLIHQPVLLSLVWFL